MTRIGADTGFRRYVSQMVPGFGLLRAVIARLGHDLLHDPRSGLYTGPPDRPPVEHGLPPLGVFKVNHFIACGWYAVGTIDFDQGSWTDALRSTPSLGYQYTTSLHWSLTQFTPASMEVRRMRSCPRRSPPAKLHELPADMNGHPRSR